MRSLVLGLVVPLFCTFAVSLPCQNDGVNEDCRVEVNLPQLFDESNNNNQFDYSGSFTVPSTNQEEQENTLFLLTDSNLLSGSPLSPLAGLSGDEFAAKPAISNQPGSKRPNSPGNVPSRPGTTQSNPQSPGNTLPRPETPGPENAGVEQGLPWTSNPDYGPMPAELRTPPHYPGLIGPNYDCLIANPSRTVVSPSHPSARPGRPPSCSTDDQRST